MSKIKFGTKLAEREVRRLRALSAVSNLPIYEVVAELIEAGYGRLPPEIRDRVETVMKATTRGPE